MYIFLEYSPQSFAFYVRVCFKVEFIIHNRSIFQQSTMRKSQSIQTQGQGRNLSATGGLLAFLLGAWVGVAASRRYEIPRCHFPGPRREMEADAGEESNNSGNRKSSWQSRLPPEVREGIEKVKAFERRYRKPESTSVVGGESGPAKETWTSEWSE